MISSQGPSGISPTSPNPTPDSQDDQAPVWKDGKKPFIMQNKGQKKERKDNDEPSKKENTTKKNATKEKDDELLEESEKESVESIFTLAKKTAKPTLPPPDMLMKQSPKLKEGVSDLKGASLKSEDKKKDDIKDRLKKEAGAPSERSSKGMFGLEERKEKKGDSGTKDDQSQKNVPQPQPAPLVEGAASIDTHVITGTSDIPPTISSYKDLVNIVASIHVRETHIEGHETTVSLKDGTAIQVRNQQGALSIKITTADYRIHQVIGDNLSYIRSALGEKNILVRDINLETSSWADRESRQKDEEREGREPDEHK